MRKLCCKFVSGAVSLFISLIVLNAGTAHSQSRGMATFHRFYNAVSGYHGNVYLDTAYQRLDTATLRRRYRDQINNQIEVITAFKLQLADVRFQLSDLPSVNIRTVQEFGREKPHRMPLTIEDSLQLTKADSLRNISKEHSAKEGFENVLKLQELLTMSASEKMARDLEAKNQPKHLKLLSAFENDKMILFIYELMIVEAYAHYYQYSELILK